jgi:hypothetical protein
MNDAEVLMPLTCSECGEEWLEGFPVDLVAGALLAGHRIRIRGRCHSREWDATPVEREQLRQYLSAGCIGPRNASARYVDVSANIPTEPPPRKAGSLRWVEKPVYRRLALEASRVVAAPAAEVLPPLRRPSVFDLVFLRRGR